MNTLGTHICWNSNSRTMNTWPVIQSCIQLHHKMNKMLNEFLMSDKTKLSGDRNLCCYLR
jgi:hypothetical protein